MSREARNSLPRGYLTPCDQSEPRYFAGKRYACESVIRLEKPGKWRCESCVKKYGALR